MNITIDDKEYPIKSRQAIEILTLVEKAGILEKMKTLDTIKDSPEDIQKIIHFLPNIYILAYDILAIACGSYTKGVLTKNTDVVDEINAVQLPIYAIQVVKSLMFPIQYVMTDDKTMSEEKKSDSVEEKDTNLGKIESKEEPKA